MAIVRAPRVALGMVSAITALLLLTPLAAYADGNSNSRVLPPSSRAFGRTYGEWSAAWWQYVQSQPVSSNPLVDASGAGCGVGQSGPVFFLVGSNGSGTLTRDKCVVPAGKALFFPLVNVFDFHVECSPQTSTVCDQLETDTEVWNDLEAVAAYHITALFATIDGTSVGNLNPATTPYRACAGPDVPGFIQCTAPAFSLTFPADNFFAPGLPAGTYGPTVADGAYLMLAPLPPGPHTLRFGGTGVAGQTPNVQDITYHLSVSSH